MGSQVARVPRYGVIGSPGAGVQSRSHILILYTYAIYVFTVYLNILKLNTADHKFYDPGITTLNCDRKLEAITIHGIIKQNCSASGGVYRGGRILSLSLKI